jgi:hypothetical protein
MSSIMSDVVPGTAGTVFGAIERWFAWLAQNVSHDLNNSLTYPQNDAATVYQNRVGSCSGFANLAKSGMLEWQCGVGIVIGHTLVGTSTFPGFTRTLMQTNNNGSHAWIVIDDGTQWIPADPYHNTIGLVTLSRVSEGTFEDESDGNSIFQYSIDPRNPATVTQIGTTTGSITTTGVYHAERERNPFTTDFAVHWYAAAHLKPSEDGPPTDVGDQDPIVDTGKRNTFVISPIPASLDDRVMVQLYLEHAAYVQADVYGADGRHVATALHQPRNSGYNYFHWFPGNEAEGVYFLRVVLDGGRQVLSKKFMFVR